MSALQHLLPPNASPFEQAMGLTLASRFPLPVHLVSDVLNPDRCPAHLLGYLAFSLSIDLWDESWPETRKRSVCRNAFQLHRLKGTLAGIKAHVALTGAEVVKTVRPPTKLFLTGGMTAEQREAWLQSLPQIRLYPYFERTVASRRVYFPRTRPLFLHQCYLRPSRGPQLSRTRVTYWDRGQETDLAYEQPSADVLRLVVPHEAKGPFLGAAYLRRLFLRRSVAREGVVTLRTSGDIGGFAAARGLDPVSIEPTRIAETHTLARVQAAFGNMAGKRFLLASKAPRHMFDRVSLNDPTRVAARRKGRVFLGHARLGSSPFQAELTIAIPPRISPLRFRRFHGKGFLLATDRGPVTRAIQAIGVSKAARDTILVSTTTHRRVSFNDGLRFGQFAFGEIRKVV
jgi:hypothetical protein